MKKYDPVEGVPPYHYYLLQMTAFADFEVQEESKILFTSTDKQELIDLCAKNGWDCPECNPGGSWYTHFIKRRSA